MVLAASAAYSPDDNLDLRIQLVVHAVGGLVVLFTTTLLSVYKPWGLTPYGQRRRLAPRSLAAEGFHAVMEPVVEPRRGTRPSMPRWIHVVGFHAIGLAVAAILKPDFSEALD